MRILIVEDEPRLLRSRSNALRGEGYAVDTAENGIDGLYKAGKYPYNVLILDVLLPKLDGWDVLARLRKTRQTPVLMVTARDAPAYRVRGLDLGTDDYLVKPFDPAELFARVRALIRRAAGQAQSSLKIGDITIEASSRTVLRRAEPVTLIALDENEGTLSNLIDVHILAIRRELGHRLITTRRGQGYSIA